MLHVFFLINTHITYRNILENLKSLDLRDNCIKEVAELRSLIHCTKLEELQLQNSDNQQSNPVCSSHLYTSSVAKLLPNLKVLDGKELVRNTIVQVDEAVQLPKFDRAAKQFLNRSKLSPEVPKVQSIPPVQKRIIHSKIIKQRSLTRRQINLVQNVLDDLAADNRLQLIQKVKAVLTELNLNKDENVYLSSQTFKFLLNSMGLEFNEAQVHDLFHFRHPSSELLCLENFLEIVSMSNLLLRDLKQRQEKVKVEVTFQLEDTQTQTPTTTTISSGTQIETAPKIVSSLSSQTSIPSPTGKPKNPEISQLIHELEVIRARLESKENSSAGTNDRTQFLEKQLEKAIDFANKEMFQISQQYESKLDQIHLKTEMVTSQKFAKLESEKQEVQSKLEKEEALSNGLNQRIHHLEFEFSNVTAKLEQSYQNGRELQERFNNYRDASEMTQAQLANQSILLASKLALCEANHAECMAQSRSRTDEGNALSDRLEKILADSRGTTIQLERSQDQLESERRKYIELENHYRKSSEESAIALKKLKLSFQNTQKELFVEKQALQGLEDKSKKHQLEKQELLQVVRDQKMQLERSLNALREKDNALACARTDLHNVRNENVQEILSLKLELEKIKSRRSDDDEKSRLMEHLDQAKSKEEWSQNSQNLRAEITALKTKVGDLEINLGIKVAMLNDQNDTIVKLRESLKSFKSEENELILQIQQAETRAEASEAKLFEAEGSLEQQQQILDSYEDAYMNADVELKAKLEAAEEELKRKNEALNMIEAEMEKISESFKKHENAIANKNEIISDLKMRNNELTTQLKYAEQQMAEIQQNFSAMQSQFQAKSDALFESEVKVRANAEKILTLETTVQKIQDQISEKDIQKEKLEKQVTDCKIEVKVLAKTLEHERKKGARNVHRFEKLVNQIRND